MTGIILRSSLQKLNFMWQVKMEMKETTLKNKDNRLKIQVEKNNNTIFDNHILTSSREIHLLVFGLISLIQIIFLSSFSLFCCNLQLIHQRSLFCSCPPQCISFSSNSLQIWTSFFNLVVALSHFAFQLTYRCFHYFDLLQNFSNLFSKTFFRIFLFK